MREVVGVILQVVEDGAVPADPVDAGAKCDDPAAMSLMFGSVHFMSFAASSANLP